MPLTITYLNSPIILRLEEYKGDIEIILTKLKILGMQNEEQNMSNHLRRNFWSQKAEYFGYLLKLSLKSTYKIPNRTV